ncbi:MAG: histone deacetylase [Acidobacteria bacterium]|nr:histone deacetylase [Acidobacteriota bacterium]
MKVFYTDKYTVELPDGHRFPMEKYRLVRESLLIKQVLSHDELHEPQVVTPEVVTLAHTRKYVESICNGTIDQKAMRRIGFPWSPSLVTRSLASVGGALCAALAALETGVSGNLAGGTHHALVNAGEGYCVFNDIAVVVLHLLKEKKIRRAAIVDLDVHQGNGNSDILGNREDVFIFSMHGEKNYPFRKVPSTLDIGLADNTTDNEYLDLLADALPKVFNFQPDIIFFQAGVDPLKEDVLGRLALSHEGLARRDHLVLSECKNRGIPVSLALGGGYAKPIELTVEAHTQTYKAVKELFPNV